jgi:hypothetical protein
VIEPKNPRALDENLRTKLGKVSDRILAGEGPPTAGEFEEIQRLAKLVRWQEETRKKKPNLLPPIALIASVLLISLPAVLRLYDVSVSFDMAVSGLQFATKDRVPVLGSIRPEQLGISGLEKVIPPFDVVLPHEENSNIGVAQSILLKLPDKSGTVSDITLERVAPQPGTRVSIVYADRPSAFEFAFTREQNESPIVMRANVSGPIIVSIPGVILNQNIVFGAAPKSFEFKGDGSSVDVVVDLRKPPSIEFYPQRVEKVNLDIVEEIPDVGVIPRSTILSGSLYWDSLDGSKVELRPGERIAFSTVKFQLDALKFDEREIRVRMHGKVRDLRRGDALETRTLMPTYLQWLIARQPLAAFWGALISLFGIIFSTLRWYKGQT